MSKKRYWWLVRKSDDISLSTMMDMLRYDSATVHGNAPDGYWMLSSENRATEDRWKSFNIRIFYPVPYIRVDHAPFEWDAPHVVYN